MYVSWCHGKRKKEKCWISLCDFVLCLKRRFLCEKTNLPITKKPTGCQPPGLSLTQCLFIGCNAICMLRKTVYGNHYIQQLQKNLLSFTLRTGLATGVEITLGSHLFHLSSPGAPKESTNSGGNEGKPQLITNDFCFMIYGFFPSQLPFNNLFRCKLAHRFLIHCKITH